MAISAKTDTQDNLAFMWTEYVDISTSVDWQLVILLLNMSMIRKVIMFIIYHLHHIKFLIYINNIKQSSFKYKSKNLRTNYLTLINYMNNSMVFMIWCSFRWTDFNSNNCSQLLNWKWLVYDEYQITFYLALLMCNNFSLKFLPWGQQKCQLRIAQ